MPDITDQSDEALFDECLRLTDLGPDAAEARWLIIDELRLTRATRTIFDRALELAGSPRTSECLVGIDVLNDCGPKADFRWRAETIDVLVRALGRTTTSVLLSALAALGKFGPPAARDQVTRLAADADDRIRLSVAQALPSFLRETALGDTSSTLTALIKLTVDEVAVVRDWATFGLGSQTDLDGTDIRSALLARLDDSDANTRHEALVALARRHDRRAVPALLRALDDDAVAHRAIVAAELLGAPEALKPLRRLAEGNSWTLAELECAIRRCDSEAQDRLLSQLTTFMALVDERRSGFCCFSDLLPVDSGGPQISYSDEQRYFTWSFEELLDRADGNVETAVEQVVSDLM